MDAAYAGPVQRNQNKCYRKTRDQSHNYRAGIQRFAMNTQVYRGHTLN